MSKAISVGCTLEREVDVLLFEGVEDRQSSVWRSRRNPCLIIFLRGRREGIERVPDGGTGEAVDDDREIHRPCLATRLGIEERARGLAGGDHFFRGALAHAFRIAVAPDVGREDGLVSLVDQVADGLADEVVGHGETGQAVVGAVPTSP